MEPGEYLTNVLSFSNFRSINYKYLETQSPSVGIARKHLQRLESRWRQEGRIVHFDSTRDGIWIFQKASTLPNDSTSRDNDLPTIIEMQGIALLQRDEGFYEPANLGRSKHAISNPINTPTSNALPFPVMESTARNTYAMNARATQSNAALNPMQDLPTPPPGAKSDIIASSRDIHEYFISAILGSIVHFMCRDQGFIPLNARTLVLSPLQCSSTGNVKGISLKGCNAVELATLDISLTALGTLLIKARSDPAPGLRSLTGLAHHSGDLAKGASLWLAPGGNAAKFHSLGRQEDSGHKRPSEKTQAGLGDQKFDRLDSPVTKYWQSECLEWLAAKGLNSAALEAGGWVLVQVLSGQSPYAKMDCQEGSIVDDLAIIPWPALLCFQTSTLGLRDSHAVRIPTAGPRDPLSFAEDWFTTADERAKVALQRQRDISAAEALSREQADIDARVLQANTYSPAALRRGSNSGAMYPTPPDAPHQPIGATPSFDGNGSTPGNLNVFASHEVGQAPPSNPGGPEADIDIWGSNTKKEQAIPSMDCDDNENENDNLFGDMGGDIFGTDITDADFSFFDEPDTMQFDQKPVSPPGPAPPTMQESTFVPTTVTSSNSSLVVPEFLDRKISDRTSRSLGQNREATSLVRSEVHDPASTQATNRQDVDCRIEKQPPSFVKLPFSKEIVFQRLVHNFTKDDSGKQSRRASSFNGLDFEDSIKSVNEKYGTGGQFKFSTHKRMNALADSSALPRVEYPSKRQIPQGSVQDMTSVARAFIEKDLPSQPCPIDSTDHPVELSDGGAQMPEQNYTSHTTDNQMLAYAPGNKRKWDHESDEIALASDALIQKLDASTSQPINGSEIPLLDSDPADWPLITYFTTPEPDIQSNALTDFERITAAQILADQAISGTFQLPGLRYDDTLATGDKAVSTKELVHRLAEAAKSCLKDFHICTMRAYLDVQGIPILNQGLRLPPRPNNPRAPSGSDAARPNNPFLITAPQLEVRRSDFKLSVVPAAVSFWENLGLGPAKGGKNVNAICLYPNFEGVAARAHVFLDQMRSVYESARFGSHDRVNSEDLDGLLPFPVDHIQHSPAQFTTSLKETVARLSRILASFPAEERNLVVYFVYPDTRNALLVQICSAFQHLFNLYKKALSEKRMQICNELVLQLIPLDFMASPTSMSVPLPSEYFRLSMEVYDRCIDFISSSSSPAIILEQTLPKSIDFKLSTTPSASLLQENTCLHVAYAKSIDDRWITAAWTDNRGTQQMTASYCLGRKNEPISMPFSDVASEIWGTTLDYVSSKKIHWRIMIVKIGVMDPSEVDFWTTCSTTDAGAQVNLTLITVQTTPSLRLLPASITLAPSGSTSHSVITPGSTPQALQSSILSPENAATPARDNPNTAADASIEPDGDARLVDYNDQSWGAILAHRLNNSNSQTDLNLSLISGYLIKRGGTNTDDPPIVMEVNVVYTEVTGNPRTHHELLLREILGCYRGLGTLARARGMVNPVKDVRPWHIAAAEKAVKALYMLI